MFSSLFRAFGFSKKESTILIVGLDGTGKSSILEHIKSPDV